MSAHDILMSAAGGTSLAANYIEDVFSTYLYTGNGSTQTITTGVDTGTKGGLIWVKKRSDLDDHALFDSVRASGSILSSNLTDAATAGGNRLALTSTGFNLQAGGGSYNQNGFTYASWTFRKQPKFFDVLTYTGNGAASQTLNHNLGSVPGCMVVKGTSAATNWPVYHRSMDASPQNFYMILDGTTAKTSAVANWGNTSPTSTQLTVGDNNNANGITYVAYLFAHNAGGFGLTGTDNVISCGSFTTDGSGNATVSLGYEPQFIIHKLSSTTGTWDIKDSMRGLPADSSSVSPNLRANVADAEATAGIGIGINATGFTRSVGSASSTYIYIAIRRGPMKVPTSGTSVFEPIAYTGTGANNRQIGASTFVVDYILGTKRNTVDGKYFYTRLQGNGAYLSSTNTNAEAGAGSTLYGPQYGKIQLGYQQGSNDSLNLDNSGDTFINYLFRRAPGFFDVVCYTGTGVARTVTHNLAAVPELIITKSRGEVSNWNTYTPSAGSTKRLFLENDSALDTSAAIWNGTAPTSLVFSVSSSANIDPRNYVAYLFATCPGVSKVGSYTGTGTTQVINCGFTSGSRFVLIKRTDATGDWYVWDSARGIVAGNDPYLLLNSTAAEVTNTDFVDPVSSGFEISSTAPAAINASGGSYIYLAIA